jgi:aryl-alcohol dehydrogenase-like predicted oxidoreductase
MEKENLSFVAFSPLAQGLLLDKFSKDNPPKFVEGDHRNRRDTFKKEYLAELEPKLNKIKNEFGSSAKELARVALQYLLHYNLTGCVIPGFRNLQQVKTNLDAIDKPLTNDEFVKSVFNH